MKKAIITFDIGGTFIKWALFNDQAQIIENGKFPTNEYAEQALKKHWERSPKMLPSPLYFKQKINIPEALIEQIEKFKNRYEIVSCGISTSGVVDIATGEIKCQGPSFKEYVGTNFAWSFKNRKLNFETKVDNDVNCAIMGEKYFGSLKNYSNCVMIAIGTGIGGGIIINNQLYYGSNYMAGEVGNLVLNKNDTWETNNSTRALITKVRTIVKDNDITAEQILANYEKYDDKVKTIIDDFYLDLALAIVNITMVLNPQAICLGGAIAQCEHFDLNKLNKILFEQLPINKGLISNLKIIKASLGNDAALYGAYSLVNRKYKV